MTERHEQALTVANRHIIERPRLTRLLDETTARVIMLIAPAGYGKTVLAHQWLHPRPQAWLDVTSAHADIAALVASIARCVSSVVGGDDRSVINRLAASPNPADDVEALAALQAAELVDWPEDGWLVLDEYEGLADSRPSEDYVRRLLDTSTLNLLVTSRRKPVWATARQQLYGDYCLIDRRLLKMGDDEARLILEDADSASAESLISAAAGWPAVLGLAAMGGMRDLSRAAPDTLYEYLAEELYYRSSDSLRDVLPKLALAPHINLEVAEIVCGSSATSVLAEAYADGYLTDDGERSSFHPLLKAFLLKKLPRSSPQVLDASAELVDFYIAQADWDSAFHVFRHLPSEASLLTLIELGSTALLKEGRNATLSDWLTAASDIGADSPMIDVLKAELASREGRQAQAEQLAIFAAKRAEPSVRFRALCIAGLASHLDNREVTALEYFKEAEELATDTEERQSARWGSLLCAAVSGNTQSVELALERFLEHEPTSIDEVVQAANAKLFVFATLGGRPDAVDDALAIAELASECDRLIATSFLNGLSRMLSLVSRYAESLGISNRAFALAEDARLEFVRPYLLLARSVALVGLGDYRAAAEMLSEGERVAQTLRDAHNMAEAHTVRARLFIACGAYDDAIACTRESPTRVTAGMRAEHDATRALALACAGRANESYETLESLPSLGSLAEAAGLTHVTRAVVAARAGKTASLIPALEAINQLGTFDPLVIGLRGSTELRRSLNRLESDTGAQLVDVFRISRRIRLRPRGPLDDLTPRELEVVQLLAQGCTNREIAQKLVIADVTAKVHVRNILRKLGVRSRTEAAVLATTLAREAAAEPSGRDETLR
jgi:ATP/maltotriose-dependent transcriptional regulator MalT